MKKIIVVLAFLMLFSLLACELTVGSDDDGGSSTAGNGENETVYETKTFWCVDATSNYYSSADGWYQLEAEKRYEGTHSIVYLETGQNVATETIESIADEFDSKIWEIVTTKFAEPTDIDNNGKVILLLLDIKDGYSNENDAYIGGYFYGVDLYTKTELSALGNPDFYQSNEAELLYIDVNPNDPASETFLSTVAHEFQHLVNTAHNVIEEGGDLMPVWIDEGLAMEAEAIYQGVDILEERELWYDADPLYSGNYGVSKDIYLSITYGYPLVIWDPYYASNSLAVLNNYALSHLFFSWLRIQLGEDDFYKTIIDMDDNSFASVAKYTGEKLGEELDSEEELIKLFYMANLLGGNGNASGLASYKGKNQHTGPYGFSGAGGAIELYPSGANYFKNSSFNEWSPLGGDAEIEYALGDVSSFDADYEAPFGTGDSENEVVLVVNTESEGTTASDSAVLPSVMRTNSLIPISESTSTVGKINGSMSNQAKSLSQSGFRVGLEAKAQGTSLAPLNK